ncbi:uncharacterized protein (TIGR03546 family) [Rhodopirellula rubra]|uniref:Uncharacterized protein (TIGR03546 family) n=1 Tax=Aporhodopirellula rubra TaxID=980271 RepID=A0A7W5E388_9BACT|nr:TIGR03546 family protein [Aporhodopirellula rubra]MBB3209401.1 uncharacterized protein (TIGR03546 family) [Aporhodopirellula rubra]
MILWTIKLISSVRKAIAGRKHPSQLAWGVAFGALLGLIPHGNLLAVALVLLVLTLRVNHAMVALVGVAVTFVAPTIDPTFDSVGRWLFDRPDVAQQLAIAWQYPLVAWTDLNNTVVAGSFVIGLVALVPLFLLTYPIFRAWAPIEDELEDGVPVQRVKPQSPAKKDEATSQPLSRVDSRHAQASRPHFAPSATPDGAAKLDDASAASSVAPGKPLTASSGRVYDVRRVDAANTDGATTQPATAATPARQTRVAIAGGTEKKESRTETSAAPTTSPLAAADAKASAADDQQKIDEALSYLLRQLRDSQDKDAA